MLIYHFGSKEGLLVAVVQAVEAEQHSFLARVAADPAIGPAEAIRMIWRRLADASLAGGDHRVLGAARRAPAGRPAYARLGMAVIRGLLLDLLATGDRAQADEAVERYIELCEFALTQNRSS